jgi:hypothetical protein
MKLIGTHLWNRGLAIGEARRDSTDVPPADSPETVTLPGSPPLCDTTMHAVKSEHAVERKKSLAAQHGSSVCHGLCAAVYSQLCDLVLNPLQCRDLIPQPAVGVAVCELCPAKRAEAV